MLLIWLKINEEDPIVIVCRLIIEAFDQYLAVLGRAFPNLRRIVWLCLYELVVSVLFIIIYECLWS